MALMTSPVDEDADYNAAVASGDIRNVLAVLERENKLPAGTLSKTAGIESGFNPNAKNPRSSAEGLFQFLDSTGRQYGLNSREEKRDPVLSALAGAQLAGDNATYLGQKIGRDPSGPEIYAAHQQGPAGAASIIANPSAPMPSLVGDKAARLNGAAGLTGGQFMDRFAAKFGMPSVAGTTSTAATPLSGSEGSDTLTGSGGSDRFTGGLASKPYQPADEGSGIGDIISAIGLSMMSGKRGNLLGNLPTILTAQEKEKARREDRRYGMWRDERNFDVGRADAAQAQANTEASRALQVRGLDTGDARDARDAQLRLDEIKRNQGNTETSQGLAREQFETAKANTAADNERADKELVLKGRALLDKAAQEKALPADLAGRMALADVFLKKAPDIEAAIRDGKMTGPIEGAKAEFGIGEAGKFKRDMKSGADALLRALTGAGMNNTEAKDYAERYLPVYTDSQDKLLDKHTRLVEELTRYRDLAYKGRGGAPNYGGTAAPGAPTPAPAASPTPNRLPTAPAGADPAAVAEARRRGLIQ